MAPSDLVLALTADIVSAHVGNHTVSAADVPAVIREVHFALSALKGSSPAAKAEPAVPVRLSVKPSYLVCLEDGKKMTMLKSYLRTKHGLTPDEYRAKWGLPADYPMVAPNYSARRSELSRLVGFGRNKGGQSKKITRG